MMDPIQRIDLENVKRVGVAAAYQAAEILQAKFGKISRVRKKGFIDLGHRGRHRLGRTHSAGDPLPVSRPRHSG